MIHWRGLFPWVLRAWPILVLLSVGIAHFCAIRLLPIETMMVNKLFGMLLQVLGGLLVLYSVNDNLGIFRSQTLKSAIFTWLKEFPIVREPISISAHGSSMSSSSAFGFATVQQVHSTVEERIAELERMLQDFRKQLQLEVQTINNRIEATRSTLKQQIGDTANRVTNLSKQLEHAAVGGFKFQALGVLLAIYGAVTSVFA